MNLIEISNSGEVAIDAEPSDLVKAVIAASLENYARQGYQPPWIGYFASSGGEIVGTCAFKTPLQDNRVEIAYFTFPGNEGQGNATEMARTLIHRARSAASQVIIVAQTLPEENASTTILRRLGFRLDGEVQHEEDGTVWHWELEPTEGQTT